MAARRLTAVALGVGLVAAACGSSGGSPTPSGSPSATAPSGLAPAASSSTGVRQWLSYHANDSRTGAVASDPSLSHATRAWTASLGGVVHGQPVAADGRVFAATEGNRVVALNPHNGHVIWSRHLGEPLTDVDATAGCGDIDPLGITSTPVIVPGNKLIYVVAETRRSARSVRHELFGLKLTSGATVTQHDVDPKLPTGEHAINLLQRASLAAANHRIYVAFGGNDGDCGNYHGWVVAVDQTGAAHKRQFEVASDGQGGAIWEAGGAPAVDAQGDVYVTTGNANPDPPQGGPDPKHYTESVVKLSPTLKPLASFKDRVAGGDEDLATGNPVLLPDHRVFAIGKTDIGYLLDRSNLRQVAAIHGICGSDPDGGPAYDVALHEMFIPCRNGGVQTVNLASHKVGRLLAGANSAPILIGSDVWALDYPEGTLYEYAARTGVTLQSKPVGGSVPNFASPSTAFNLLLIGTNTGVTAFR